MIAKRIIPCLDVRNGRVVKGTNFEGIQDVADPVEMAKYYNDTGADELVFYDITASFEGRGLFTDILKRTAAQVFIPLTVGGAINEVSDFERVLSCGADKRYGDQCVVLSMDVKRVDGSFRIFAKGGRIDTGIDALQWAHEGQERGAGELVVNSIDTDGVKQGFDLEMLSAMGKMVSIPIIASGGAGNMEHFKTLFETVPQVDAGLAASIFHRKEVPLPALKAYLAGEGIPMRILRTGV